MITSLVAPWPRRADRSTSKPNLCKISILLQANRSRSRVSVIDRFEDELVARLRELRPLAIEYQELEKVARHLGLDLDDGHPPPARKRKPSRKTTPTQRITATAAQSAPTGKASAATGHASGTNAGRRRGRALSSEMDKRRRDNNRQSRRQQDVLRLIRDRPGITVKEIATKLGVDATNLYRHVHKLQQDALITKHGTALQPNSR
jgi:uncharacterized membrane protein